MLIGDIYFKFYFLTKCRCEILRENLLLLSDYLLRCFICFLTIISCVLRVIRRDIQFCFDLRTTAFESFFDFTFYIDRRYFKLCLNMSILIKQKSFKANQFHHLRKTNEFSAFLVSTGSVPKLFRMTFSSTYLI